MTLYPSFPRDAERVPSEPAQSVQPDLVQTVLGILAAQALRAPESLRFEMTTEQLGLDSLGMTEVIFAIEEQFDISVPFEGMMADDGFDLASVGGIVAAVERLLAARAAPINVPAIAAQ